MEAAKVHFGTPQEKAVRTVTVSEMKKLHAEGHFKAGSMGPKVDAAMRFVRHGGEAVIGKSHRGQQGPRRQGRDAIVPAP